MQATLVAFVNWLSAQLRRPSDTARSVPAAIGALALLLREKPVRQLFTRNGVLQHSLHCGFVSVNYVTAQSTFEHRLVL